MNIVFYSVILPKDVYLLNYGRVQNFLGVFLIVQI